MPLILCSITFSIIGFGPLLITVRALAWVTLRTVAALSHGTPNIALRPPMPTKTSKSKWNPEPLAIFLSGLLMIRLWYAGGTKGRKCHAFLCWWVSELCNTIYDDPRCDLRLQKDENEDKYGWYAACKHQPDRESLVLSKGVDEPASLLRVGHHQTFGNNEFL